MKEEQQPQRIDYGIVLSVMLLAIIGIVALYATASIQDGSMMMPIMQIVWFGMGTIVAAIIMMFNSEQLWKLTNYLYWGGIVALILTLFLYDRSMLASNGARSWIRIPIVNQTLQPSEFVKIPYILMLAKVVTRHNAAFKARTNQTDFKLLGKIALYSVIPIALIILQNDLGTSLVYIAISAGVILLSGVRWQILLPIFLTIVGISLIFIFLVVYNREFLQEVFGIQDYQFRRIDTWLNPLQDTSSSSYQVVQSFKAIGSGGVFGKGIGNSEVYVPVRESDMVMATIGENFGFAGSAFLIFVYLVLVYNMIKVVYDTRNEFYAYIATGVIMMIVFHVFENIGMNIGLLPVTGIPLPFISQGGSALLGNMMGIGLIMSMRFHHKSYYSAGEGKELHSRTSRKKLKNR